MTHYSRSAWGARRHRGSRTKLRRDEVEGIALHWPAMGSRRLDDVDEVKAALRGWQDYHMDDLGWSDIGYQVAVDQAGNTYRLRGLENRSGANGDQDVNERFGAILLVLGEGEKPSPALVEAVRGIIRRQRRTFTRSRRIVGHQDIRPEPTACPGPLVQRLIDAGTFNPARSNL